MSQRNYLDFTTERVHDGLNFNRNHRFFLVYGKMTDDEFLTRSMYRTSLRETLWATLKANNIERVVFYSAADKFFFLDDESASLAERLGGDAPRRGKTPPATARAGMQCGPLGFRNVLARPSRLAAPATASSAPAEARAAHAPGEAGRDEPARTVAEQAAPPAGNGAGPPPGVISMSRSRGGGGAMSDPAVLNTLNDFICDGAVRTAIVIEELENLSRFDGRIKDQLAARLKQWSALRADNRNVLLFITNREPGDERGVEVMRDVSHEFPEISNLINVALGEQVAEAEGFIWYVPPPYEQEVARLIDELRLKRGVALEWAQRDSVVRWLAAENMQFKKLDGLFSEYVNHLRSEGERLSLELVRRRRWVSGDSDPRPAMERLEQMIGLGDIKQEVTKLVNYLRAEKKRREQNPELAAAPLNLHLMLTGNPGTGKTTVARLIGEIYRDIGLLRRGHTVECKSSDLVAGYVGQTGPKTNTQINGALDGVLFIDEAYALSEGENEFGREAITTLVARMENERHRLAVIVAGYPAEMERFITSNPGLSRRFPTKIHLRDYYTEELLQIFEQMIASRGHSIGGQTRETLRGLFARMYALREDKNYFKVGADGKSGYGNAGTVRELVEGMFKEQANRLGGDISPELMPDDIPADFRRFLRDIRQAEGAEEELARLMEELNALVGLRPVKELVKKLVMEQRLAIMRKRDMSATGKTRHMLFTGNPGTGKTTVARLIGRIYKALGILQKGEFFEVKRHHLVGQYLGETAQKTSKVIEGALDSVLFIDEAYSLAQDSHDPYGREAINTLVPALEDYRDRLVVIFAGYTSEMQDFLNANSGIESRIGYTIEFPDYTADELLEIFVAMASEGGYAVPEDVRAALLREFAWVSGVNGSQFGNARGVRVKFYDRMVEEWERRMFEAHEAGQDIEEFPRAFVLSDVPEVAPRGREGVIPPDGRTRAFSISGISAAQQQAVAPVGLDIPEAVGRAVAFIKTDQGSGTGFLISPEGLVLTAYHVVEGARSIRVRLNGSPRQMEASYVDGDKEADLAVLGIGGRNLPFANLAAPGYPLKYGMMLGLLGYPMGDALGTEVTYTSGSLSSIRQSPEGVSVFQIDVSAYAGNSGGPVFLTQTGEVIGVLSYGPNDTLNFAVSTEELYRRFK
jgi:SpoVK/Ycf46/Vps4 family AAA+-type ATPase